MNSKFLSVAPTLLQCQNQNDFPDQLPDFLSSFSPAGPVEPFQTPFYEGVLDSSLGSRSPFTSDYASEDSFVDVMSPVSPSPEQLDETRGPSARNAELSARAHRKRKQSKNVNTNDGCDSDSAGSRSPTSDYTDMSMSPGPSNQSTSWDNEEEDIRRKRLARKAELARVSRKKKKDRIEELESQLVHLQNELRNARSMAAVKSEPINCQPENAAPAAAAPATATADGRLNRAMSDFANPNYLGAFYTAFIDKVREDMSQIDHLQGSMQSLCLRFVQWIMNQNDKFYEDPCGLWHSLFYQEVGATETQLAQLHELRKEFAQKQLMSGPDMVSQAFECLRKAMDDSSRLMGAFAQIFSPAQLVVFFQWVERFGPVCIKINL